MPKNLLNFEICTYLYFNLSKIIKVNSLYFDKILSFINEPKGGLSSFG